MLSRMAFYNLNTAVMREPQKPERGETLEPDGGNLTSVFRRLHETAPGTQLRIVEYLGHVVPGISRVDTIRPTPSYETLQFRQRRGERDRDWWQFGADEMSDGTLRSLGVLVALFQEIGRAHV